MPYDNHIDKQNSNKPTTQSTHSMVGVKKLKTQTCLASNLAKYVTRGAMSHGLTPYSTPSVTQTSVLRARHEISHHLEQKAFKNFILYPTRVNSYHTCCQIFHNIYTLLSQMHLFNKHDIITSSTYQPQRK